MRLRLFIFVLITALPISYGYGDSPEEIERHVRAALIYQFTKYIEWPTQPRDFVIDVVEDGDLLKVIVDSTLVRDVNGRKIVIQDAKWTDIVIKPPDIVVFPHKDSQFPKALIEKLKGKPCLTVAYGDGLGNAGAVINFFVEDGRMRFELNLKAAEENRLKVSPTLQKLGKLVK